MPCRRCSSNGAFAACAHAQSAPPAAPAIDPFQQAIAARTVADFARRQKDPQAMIVAARMLQEVPVADKPVEDAAPVAGAAPAAFSPAGLFAEAKTLARGDTALLMQINVAQSTGSRGVFGSTFGKGLVRLVKEVSARGGYSFSVSATGGQVLRIGAIGDLGTTMLMRLVDAAGRVVCLADEGDYAPVCATTPRANGSYKVEILNRSPKASRTVILSN